MVRDDAATSRPAPVGVAGRRAVAAPPGGAGAARAPAPRPPRQRRRSSPGDCRLIRGGGSLMAHGRDGTDARGEGQARRCLLRPLQGASAPCLLLRLYRIGNHHDAEDLTEQTFLQATGTSARAQRVQGRPLRPWPSGSPNLAANYYRDRSRRPQTPIDDVDGTLSAPHTRSRWWRAAGPGADPGRRAGAARRPPRGADHALRPGDGQPEIARALDRSDGATKVLLHRAIKQLEEIVKRAEGPTEPS